MPKVKDTVIPLAYWDECLEADFKTGTLTWRIRPRGHFPSERLWASWNAQYAGKTAGTPFKGGYHVVTLTFESVKYRALAHRIVFALKYGYWPAGIDHKHGVSAGDGIANLRAATQAENTQNAVKRIDNASDFPGVSWSKREGKWAAQICLNKSHYNLGYYSDYIEACLAYCAAKAIMHPFAPVPRGVTMPEIKPYDRSAAAYRLIYAARRRGDHDLELDAWETFLTT
jgi:hypothetical protein